MNLTEWVTIMEAGSRETNALEEWICSISLHWNNQSFVCHQLDQPKESFSEILCVALQILAETEILLFALKIVFYHCIIRQVLPFFQNASLMKNICLDRLNKSTVQFVAGHL